MKRFLTNSPPFCLCGLALLLIASSARADESGHFLVAHYPFDTTNSDGSVSGTDTSGNGNDINAGSTWGTNSPGVSFSTNAIAGGGAMRFQDLSSVSPPVNVVQSLSGSFSVSAWIKTSQIQGATNDPAVKGAAVIEAFKGDGTLDVIPISITGGKVAFFTGSPDQSEDNLHSIHSVNNNLYTHIVVTRSQATGEKKIYLNGALDNSDFGSSFPLTAPQNLFDLALGGGVLDGNYDGYVGLLDDVQFYTGVLSASDVLQLYQNPGSTMANLAVSANRVAHYTFDDPLPGPLHFDHDLSGNNNNLSAFTFGGGGVVSVTGTNAQAGAGAAQFDGGSFLSYTTTPSNLLSTLAGSFSISLWVQTSQDDEDPDDYAFSGYGIISADVPGLANDLVPIALTGGQVAVNTGGDSDVTLNSSGLVNDGAYHHIVVSRIQPTGEKKIYIDGVLDSSEFDTTNMLNDPVLVTIGAIADASSSDPNNASPYNGFAGNLDDIQIYSDVLSDSDIVRLFHTPGLTIGDESGTSPAALLAHYSFDNTNNALHDDSGNGNDMNLTGGGGAGGYAPSTNAEAGAAASLFSNPDGASEGYIGYYPSAPAGLLAALADDFSISLWLKTTQVFGNDSEPGNEGAGIVWADVGGVANDTIPMALTGHKLAFMTGGNEDDTLHSSSSVDTGSYVHVVVTRNRASGLKKIYINGTLDTSASGTTNLLNDPTQVFFGSNPGDDRGFDGLLDDLQIYSGLLDPLQVSYLFANPGMTAPPTILLAVNPFNLYSDGTDLHFSFTTVNGYQHTVQYSDDLSPGSWHDYTTYGGDGSTVSVSIPMNGSAHRFFRINTHPPDNGGGA